MTKTSKRYGFSELIGLFGRLLKPVTDAFAAETGKSAKSVAAGMARRLVNQALDAVLPAEVPTPVATPDMVAIIDAKPNGKPRLARSAAQIRRPKIKKQPPKVTKKPKTTPPKPKDPKAKPAKAAPKPKVAAKPTTKRKPKGPGKALPNPLPPLFPVESSTANNGLAPAPRGWPPGTETWAEPAPEKYTVPVGADLG